MREDTNIYMVGVGGMGMCPLAIYLAQAGYNVSGVDDNMRPEVALILKKNGVRIDLEKRLPEICDSVIYSSAIGEEDEIFVQGRERGIPFFRRGEYLARVVGNKKLLAIIGSHGKTTTAGMLIHALNRAGVDFSFLLGGLFNDESILPARYCESDWIVAEIDESDGTIDEFSPEVTLVVNFDWDHPARYGCIEDLERTFLELFRRTRCAVIMPQGYPNREDLKKRGVSCELRTYGSDGDYKGDFYIGVGGGDALIDEGPFT